MKHTFPLIVAIALVIAAGFAAVAAQDTDPEFDLDQIRARAGEFTEDAEALATAVRSRADGMVNQARATRNAAEAARTAHVASLPIASTGAPFDFDAMVRTQAEAERAALGDTPQFIAFVSLSLPPETLRRLVADVARAGGVTVLRGFPQGDSARFKRELAAIWNDGDAASSLGIDPRLFRAFAVQTVPSFVMLGSDFTPCDGFACQDQVPPHDRLAGNVSVAHVLETFAQGRGPGSALARTHLARLTGDDQ